MQIQKFAHHIRGPLLASALWSGAAAAAPGDHIRSGNAELTPAIGVWGGWRSNVYLQEGELGGGVPVQPGAFIEVKPSLKLKVESQDVKLKLGAAYSPRLYLNSELSNLNRFSFFDVGGQLHLLPSSVVGLKLNEAFNIFGRETEAESADWAYLTVLDNSASGYLSVHPGSSMEIDLGGRFDFTDYKTDEDTNPLVTGQGGALGLASLNSRMAYGPRAALSWKFLPKTAYLFEYSQSWYRWKDNFLYARGDGLNPSPENNFNAYLGIPDSMELRLSTGLRGRFTEKLILGLQLGLVRMTYDEQSVIDDAADSAVGVDLGNDTNASAQGFDQDLKAGLGVDAEIGYDFVKDNRVTLGYRRDYADIYFTNFVAYHQFTVAYSGLVAERLKPELSMSLRRETYQGEIARLDNFLRFRGDLTYKITKYLDVSGGAWWTQRASVDTPGDDALLDANGSIEYDDVNVHLGLTFTY